MSPIANSPGTAVLKSSVLTVICFLCMAAPHCAMGPSCGESPKLTSTRSTSASCMLPSASTHCSDVKGELSGA